MLLWHSMPIPESNCEDHLMQCMAHSKVESRKKCCKLFNSTYLVHLHGVVYTKIDADSSHVQCAALWKDGQLESTDIGERQAINRKQTHCGWPSPNMLRYLSFLGTANALKYY